MKLPKKRGPSRTACFEPRNPQRAEWAARRKKQVLRETRGRGHLRLVWLDARTAGEDTS
jgi:hypothetical protein